jgi:hypothetical protein
LVWGLGGSPRTNRSPNPHLLLSSVKRVAAAAATLFECANFDYD